MRDRLVVREQTLRSLRRTDEVCVRLVGVLAEVEVARQQLDRSVVAAVERLRDLADLAMEIDALAAQHAGVHDLLGKRMMERNGAFGRAVRLIEKASSDESRHGLFDASADPER